MPQMFSTQRPSPALRSLERSLQAWLSIVRGAPRSESPSLRELDHASHPALELWKGTEAGLVGLGIDEQRQRRPHGVGARAGDRRTLTRRVQFRQAPFRPGGREELIGTLER